MIKYFIVNISECIKAVRENHSKIGLNLEKLEKFELNREKSKKIWTTKCKVGEILYVTKKCQEKYWMKPENSGKN